MTSNNCSPPPYAISQSLALFCGTAILHRRLQLRRERRTRHTSRSTSTEERDYEDSEFFHSQGLRKRISFNGHASLHAHHFDASNTSFATVEAAASASASASASTATTTNICDSSSTRFTDASSTDAPRSSSFVIFGGDEMDDDEVQNDNNNCEQNGSMNQLDAEVAVARRSTLIKEGTEGEEEESEDGKNDEQNDDRSVSPWDKVGGFLRQVSGISRGVSFFVEGADDDGLSYHERSEDDIDSSGTSISRQRRSTHGGDIHVASMDGRRCSSQPSMTDLASHAALASLAQKKELNMRESARADYNSRIMPNKVVLIRHGQSEGNVEESLYATTPDNAMKLTALGWDQAKMAGRELRERIIAKDESVHFIVSPYVRTVESFHGIISAWCDPAEFNHMEDREKRIKAWYGRLTELGISWHEDPRIREQDFGNYQDPVAIKKCKRERHKFGTFYYRFPHGESASDVYDRVSTFLDSLWRSFDLKRSQNYVLVTHGISIRILLSRYFRYSIDQFNMLANPKNCDQVVLEHDGRGRLRLEGRHELVLKKRCEQDEDESDEQGANEEMNGDSSHQYQTDVLIKGYRYQHRLRMLPKEWRVKRKIRLSFGDAE